MDTSKYFRRPTRSSCASDGRLTAGTSPTRSRIGRSRKPPRFAGRGQPLGPEPCCARPASTDRDSGGHDETGVAHGWLVSLGKRALGLAASLSLSRDDGTLIRQVTDGAADPSRRCMKPAAGSGSFVDGAQPDRQRRLPNQADGSGVRSGCRVTRRHASGHLSTFRHSPLYRRGGATTTSPYDGHRKFRWQRAARRRGQQGLPRSTSLPVAGPSFRRCPRATVMMQRDDDLPPDFNPSRRIPGLSSSHLRADRGPYWCTPGASRWHIYHQRSRSGHRSDLIIGWPSSSVRSLPWSLFRKFWRVESR